MATEYEEKTVDPKSKFPVGNVLHFSKRKFSKKFQFFSLKTSIFPPELHLKHIPFQDNKMLTRMQRVLALRTHRILGLKESSMNLTLKYLEK